MACCNVVHLGEDNMRVALLAAVLLLYMLLGAFIFQQLESAAELTLTQKYQQSYTEFTSALDNGTADYDALHRLLDLHATVTSAGVIHGRRWDFAGSFHFVSTIVSTIGKSTIAFVFLI